MKPRAIKPARPLVMSSGLFVPKRGIFAAFNATKLKTSDTKARAARISITGIPFDALSLTHKLIRLKLNALISIYCAANGRKLIVMP
tara:strand:- start:1092 stop:1352 length:261 start_codon:yes stop_codon:yes gene_type:complete